MLSMLSTMLSPCFRPCFPEHLKAQGLVELFLLVHGGFNAFAYATPSNPRSLPHIAQDGANFYAQHLHRRIFDRVWFFESLNSADEINQLFGHPPGHGRVSWLAQLWPEFKIYAGSLPA
jgi:hypothetical protein